MPTLTVKHEGGVASSINVRGHKVIADVPQASGGEDRGPTPMELLVGSLGACIALYVARYCRQANLPHEGFEVAVEYAEDAQAGGASELNVRMKLPTEFPAARRSAVLRVAAHCPVHATLSRQPRVTVAFAD